MIDPRTELARLCKALDERKEKVSEALDWYSGNHPIPTPPPNTAAATDGEARLAFEAMSKLAVTNLLPPIADAPARKLRVESYRFSQSPTATDADAWEIHQRNGLDTEYSILNEAVTQTGQAFILVWVGADGLAEITIEDPQQCIVSYDAGARRQRRSALKRWTDNDGYTRANVYLPDAIHKFRSKTPTTTNLVLPGYGEWDTFGSDGAETVANPYGEVPMFEAAVGRSIRPSLFGGGKPVFSGQLNEQRKLNLTVMQALVTAEYQAFRQRWVTGWDYPLLEDGTPDKAAIARASAARLMTFTTDSQANPMDGKIEVGEFAQADFRPFIDMMLQWVKFMAATSSTPPYAFLLGDMINVAAESLARIEGVHLAMVRSLGRELSGGIAQAMRLALRIEGNSKADDPSITVHYAELEERTGSEIADLAKTASEIGAPDEAVFAMFPGVDAAEAQRWARQKRADELMRSTSAAQATQAPEPVEENDGE